MKTPRTFRKKRSKSVPVPQGRGRKKKVKKGVILPSLGVLIRGGKAAPKKKKRAVKRTTKIKSKRKSSEIERKAQERIHAFKGGIKQAEEILRTEKKYRHAFTWHNEIRKKTQSTAGKLAVMKKYGLYNPRAKTPKKSQIEKAWNETRDFIEPGYLFTPRPKGDKAWNTVKQRAAQSGYKVTDKGVFVKVDYQTKNARIKKNSKTGYEIVTDREFHDGFGKKRKETIHTPLATADEVEDLKEHFEERFNAAARGAKGNKRVRIYIEGKYGSIKTFKPEDFDLMWSILEKYEAMTGSTATQYGFMNRIKFGISGPHDEKNKVPTKHDAAVAKTKRTKKQRQPDMAHTVFKKFRGQGKWVYHAEYDDIDLAESAVWQLHQKGYKTKIVSTAL